MESPLCRGQHLPLNPDKDSRLAQYFYNSKIYPKNKRCGGEMSIERYSLQNYKTEKSGAVIKASRQGLLCLIW